MKTTAEKGTRSSQATVRHQAEEDKTTEGIGLPARTNYPLGEAASDPPPYGNSSGILQPKSIASGNRSREGGGYAARTSYPLPAAFQASSGNPPLPRKPLSYPTRTDHPLPGSARPPAFLSDTHALTVQAKLLVGKPDDKYEREADAVADKVMTMPAPSAIDTPKVDGAPAPALQKTISKSPDSPLQLKCEECEEEKVQMKPAGDSKSMAAANPEEEDEEGIVRKKPAIGTASNGESHVSQEVSDRITAAKGGGQPLSPDINAEMSAKIGADFSGVRIHNDHQSAQMSQAIGAKAFTHGSDIYFNQGQYDPKGAKGKHLLAHELTHTVQQGAAIQTKPTLSKTPPKVQGLFGIVRERLNEYARYIPGWSLFIVLIGYNPLLGQRVPRTGENLVGGLLELVPVFGALLMDKLREHNILTSAFNRVKDELHRLDLSMERLERTIDDAYEDMDFIRFDPFDYNVGVLRRHFVPLLNDVTTFAGSIARQILQIIKDALMAGLKTVADAFPGYSLLTKLLGSDPLTGEEVTSSTAEKIEDFLLLIGKEQELEKMRQEGTIQETADWLDDQLATLNFSIEEITGLFRTAWEAFSMEDLRNPAAAFNRTIGVFRPFTARVFTFASSVSDKVLEFIKNALLSQLSDFARERKGYPLLTVLLGEDPFTKEVVDRNVGNIVRGFMSLMDGGEEQFRQMRQTGAIERATARVNAAVARLGFSLTYIIGLFMGLWNSFTIDDIFNPIGAFARIVETLAQPLARLFAFIVRIVRIMVEVLLEIMQFPTETIASIIGNASQAFEDIKRDPIGFLTNLLRAVRTGFSQFFDNVATHLLNGLRDWLFGELTTAGIQPPEDLSFRSVLGFVLSTLGITIDNVWERLALKIGPERVEQIRGAMDTLTGVWTFIKDVYERGPIAIWEYIQEQLGNLWDMVQNMVKDWIVTRIITQVTTKLLSMLDPTGIMAVVNSFIAFYRAVQSFVEKLRELLEIVNSFAAGTLNIARGNIAIAANYLESSLAGGVPVAVSFLANQVGLRGLGERVSEMIEGLRERVNGAIDWLIDKAVSAGGALLDAGKQVAGTVMGWLGFRQQFRLANGEKHEMYFEDNTPQARIMIASKDPQTLESIISTGRWQDNKIPQDKLQIISAETAKINAKRGSTTVEQGQEIRISFNTIVGVLDDIGGAPIPTTNVVTKKTRGSGTAQMGEEVYVNPLSLNPGSLSGSQPTVDSDMGRELKSRYPNYFVAGHLLNHNLHGPGNERWNLTPITQRANSQMKTKTERAAKAEVLSEGAVISYHVKINYKAPLNPADTSTYPEKQMADTIAMEVKELESVDGNWTPKSPQPKWAKEASDSITNDTSTVPGFGNSTAQPNVIISSASPAELATIENVDSGLAQKIYLAKQQKRQRVSAESTFRRFDTLANFEFDDQSTFTNNEKNIINGMNDLHYVKLYSKG